MSTLLVCGGRNYDDAERLYRELDLMVAEIPGITRLIHGAARGVDSLAAEWGESRRLKVVAYLADWKMFGVAAGGIRNSQMLAEGRPDYVVAFPGGRGTADMRAKAERAKLPVRMIRA